MSLSEQWVENTVNGRWAGEDWTFAEKSAFERLNDGGGRFGLATPSSCSSRQEHCTRTLPNATVFNCKQKDI